MGSTTAEINLLRLFGGLLLAAASSAQVYERLPLGASQCPASGYRPVSHEDCYDAAQNANGGWGWIIQHTGQRVYPPNDPPQARYISNSGHPNDMRYPCGCFFDTRTMNQVFTYREILYNNRPDRGCKGYSHYYGVICEVATPTTSPTEVATPTTSPTISPTDLPALPSFVPTGHPAATINSCEIDRDCASVKRCNKNPSRCKCKDKKCRKKKKDCATRGSEARWWGCGEGKECVAQAKGNGKTWKWGKCRMMGLI